MNVLFWLEPFAEMYKPGTMATWLSWYEQLDEALAQSLPEYQAQLIAFDSLQAQESRFAERCMTLSQREIRLDWQVAGELYFVRDRDLGQGTHGQAWGDLLKQRLNGFVPDVVFLLSQSGWLRAALPSALFVNVEVAWLFHRPYPEGWQLDPAGWGKGRFLRENWRQVLSSLAYTVDEQRFIAQFKQAALGQCWVPKAYEHVAQLRQTCRLVRLLPLAERMPLDGQTPMFAILQRLLEEEDPSIHHLVTLHPLDLAVTEQEQAYLCQRHSNLSFLPQGQGVNTQTVLPWVDEVVADFSSVAMQALIFDVEQIYLGDRLPLADALFRLRNPLASTLATASKQDKDKALLWLLTRSSVERANVFSAAWLGPRIAQFVEAQQSGDWSEVFAQQQISMAQWRASGWMQNAPQVPQFARYSQSHTAALRNPVRAIAFHLPQYHRVAENDRWWGEGFTEWTNVRQAAPSFEGHYQPHVPAEMGYYDLADIAVLARQAQLAREHGLEGFCFYYYWFDGKRLLEKPVDMLLEHPEIELPFCLCWANENWTRRWDGGDQEVLMAQTYAPELDERFARDLLPYFNDPRYIRIGGKPVLLVYRGDIIPDLKGTLAAWRKVWREAGVGEVYLVGVESFRVYDPDEVGFEANCEFLPHQVDPAIIAPDEPLVDPRLSVQFLGDYNKLADHWSERPRPHYKRFRSLVPSWDNSSRRKKGRAGLFVNATPARYQSWLERSLVHTCEEFEGDERLVFINAWNEWAEGCHLEPDERFGRGYLEATRAALQTLQQRLPIQAKPFAGFQQDYQRWCAARVLAPGERARIDERMASWGALPRVLIVIDVLDSAIDALQATLESIARQTYAVAQIWLRSEPMAVQGAESVQWLPETRDWAVLDAHLQRAEHDWVLLLRAGDVLDEQALLLLADHSANHPGLACCYFDEDRVLDGQSTEPFFKPDFNLDLLRSYPYCGRVLAFERSALLEAGGFIGHFAVLSPLDLLWRVFERKGFASIGHIAHVMIHCRHGLGRWLAEPAVQEQAARVVSAHLSRLGISHHVSPGSVAPLSRVRYNGASQPLVSIVVHAHDQLPLLQRCVESIFEKTSYPAYELLLIDNASQQAESLSWFAGMQALANPALQVIRLDQRHSQAALFNLAAARAQGEYVLLLAADTAVIEPGWLEAMLNHAQRPEVGIVGARLIGADQRIRHGGLVLGLYGVAGRPFEGADASLPGYMHRASVEQNYSAVSADCMLVRREVLLALQGFDESALAQPFADVDFCLRARADGYLTVWTPYATLLQGGNGDRRVQPAISEASIDLFYERWLGVAAADPAYSPSLSVQADFRLESSPEQLPWQPFAARAVPSFLCHAADQFGSGQYRVIQPFNALRDHGFAQGR